MLREQDIPIHVAKYIPAPAEKIFDTWLDPAHIDQWFFKSDKILQAHADPFVDGHFRFLVQRDGEAIEHKGKYLEVIRPAELSFTFEVPSVSHHASVVTLNFEKLEKETLVKLSHHNVLKEYHERTAEGWYKILDRLSEYLTVKN